MQVYDDIVVGAGLTGLTLARKLAEGHRQVLVVDKGRGRGGRMATRRWSDKGIFFEHGLGGFEKIKIIDDWLDEFDLRDQLFELEPLEIFDFTSHYFVKGGASKLGRALSGPLEVRNSFEVAEISRAQEDLIRIQSAAGELVFASRVLLTMPIPQIRNLLLSSDDQDIRGRAAKLPSAEYEKVICLLAEIETLGPLAGRHHLNFEGNLDVVNMSFRHGLSSAAVAVFLSGAPAEALFEEDSQQKSISLKSRLMERGIGPIVNMDVHSWRYAFCKMSATLNDSLGFSELRDGRLFACGEFFAGRGATGAVASAYKLASHLLLTPT